MERNINEIKEKLKSLGYLEWRIGDFFVGRKPRFLVLISKISFIGAILFGFGFTLLYLITNLPLVSNFLDLFLLFIYISVSIFLILFVFFSILGLVINYPLKKLRLKAKPSNALFHIITIIFSILIMGYLFLWLKGQVFPSLYYFFVILIPLFIIFIIFFRIFLITIFLMMGNISSDPLPSRKVLVILSILILLSLIPFLFLERLKDKGGESFSPERTGIKVAIIGVDGFDMSFAKSLIEEGKLPFLKTLFENGFICKYRAKEPRIPAIFWTTVATGSPPEEHNIRAFQSTSLIGVETPLQFKRDPSGILWVLNSLFLNTKIAQLEPISSYFRNSKTLWEIFSEKGLRIGQINWWASWPADEVRDFSITDRAFEKIKERMELEMDYYPHYIKDDLFHSLDLSESFQPDSFISNTIQRLFEIYSPDLFMVYLPGLDIQWENNFKNPIEDVRVLKNSITEVENAFLKEDSILEKITGSLKDYAKIFVFDPGRNLRNKGMKKGEDGIVIFQGFPFKKGSIYEPQAPERIAPTVLFISGFPISERMKAPLMESINEEFKKFHKIKIIKSFGRKKEKKVVSKFNKELLENLRSLGYIE
jgi:hypothetical protein